jgi:hypothetical protein
VRSLHPEDFELLCYTAGELEEVQSSAVRTHVEECGRCLTTLTELRHLDADLRATMRTEALEPYEPFAPDDPFRKRPTRSFRSRRVTSNLADRGMESAKRGSAEVEALLAAAECSPEELQRYLDRLSFEDPAARYLLLYALEEAAPRVPGAPGRFLRFAEAAILRLEREALGTASVQSDADALVALSTLVGQAHQLAGQAANWTGGLDKGRIHLENAYRSLRWERDGDEIHLAMTEFDESQRRAFAGLPRQAVALARRAQATFERFGMEDYAARARVPEGIALAEDGDNERALQCYRVAMPVFETSWPPTSGMDREVLSRSVFRVARAR